MSNNTTDFSRYTSQICLENFGLEGQKKLFKSTVAIIGCGGLGSIAAPYLAGAGIGKLHLIDGDMVSLGNLHRQIIYSEINKIAKVEALEQHLVDLNSQIDVVRHHTYIENHNISEILSEVDVVLECSDSASTKYLVDAYCRENHKPLIYASIGEYIGYAICFNNGEQKVPALKDIFPSLETANPCSVQGIFNTVAGFLGILQANICLTHILGTNSVGNKLLVFNALTLELKKFNLFQKE